jgi:hypothetical protein
MEQRSNILRCSEDEQLKQLARLVRQGRFFEVQEWLSAGKALPTHIVPQRETSPRCQNRLLHWSTSPIFRPFEILRDFRHIRTLMSRVQFKLSTQLVTTLAANIPPDARSAFAELVLGQVLNAPSALRHARLQLGLPIYYCCEEELVPKPVGPAAQI